MSAIKPNKLGGYAGIPGTGPEGKTCRGCDHVHYEGASWRCRKWVELKGWSGADVGRKPPPIRPYEAACRYFEPAGQDQERGAEK